MWCSLLRRATAVPIPLTFVGYPATGVDAPDGTQYSVTFGKVPEPAALLLGLQGLLLTCYIAFRATKRSPREPDELGDGPSLRITCEFGPFQIVGAGAGRLSHFGLIDYPCHVVMSTGGQGSRAAAAST